MFNIKLENAGRELACNVQVIFMTSLKILGAIVPPCEVLMYSQHFRDVLNSGKGDGTFLFIIVMFNNLENQIFQYNGSPITFQKGDSVMINATEMAKPFGKLAKDWLSNKSTKEFLSTLSAVRTIPLTDLVEIKQGGNGEQGTWMHEDVAMEFARWLSPAFAIWCNDRIKELLQYGMTATQPTLEQMINNPDLVISLATQLKNEREEKQRIEQQNALQEEQLRQAAPKVNYYDNHLQSVNTQTSTQVAKQIGLDAEKLHKKLKEIGIIYRQSGQWILHAPYSTWGLHSTRTQTYTRSDGSTGTSVYTVWTTKGVRFIIALYENDWNVRKAIKQIKGELNPAA
jgi:phage antirepressor YoqD-like protein